MSHPLDEFLQAQKRGLALGLPSICSAHPWVLRTALKGDASVLVESTCNQVNQFGGYTGMTPAHFVRFVRGLAAQNNFPPENILLGGDHLGPSPWQAEPADLAMQKAQELVRACVLAGYTKIHLDASMPLGDDAPGALPVEVIARRAALLAHAAETAAPDPDRLRYVIGTEVPVPGGATLHDAHVHVTTVEDTRQTLAVTRTAFLRAGLEPAWQRVLALVVQPGVEFGDDFVLPYDPPAASDLVHFVESTDLVFEAHSTDYQSPAALKDLVRDHFAILKVGPALTFAFRQAVFSLAGIEQELVAEERRSHIIESLETAMLRDPRHWQNHYHGTPQEQAYKRKNSLSDRIRYYWSLPGVQASLDRLLENLGSVPLPETLLRASVPDFHQEVRSGRIANSPYRFIPFRIQSVLDAYRSACSGQENELRE